MTQVAGRRRTQAERTRQTRGDVIAATIKALAEDGYQGATTRRIAGYAGVSLGAVAHHFPSRSSLIAAALGDVTSRVVGSIESSLHGLDAGDGRRSTGRLLDALWSSFSGESFLVWLRVWLAAANDPELEDAVVEADRRMSEDLADVLGRITPPGVSRRDWMRRTNVALDAIRGLSLVTHFQPDGRTAPDRWPATRRELERLFT